MPNAGLQKELHVLLKHLDYGHPLLLERDYNGRTLTLTVPVRVTRSSLRAELLWSLRRTWGGAASASLRKLDMLVVGTLLRIPWREALLP